MTDYLAEILAEDRATRPDDWADPKPSRKLALVEPAKASAEPKARPESVAVTLPGGLRARTVHPTTTAEQLDELALDSPDLAELGEDFSDNATRGLARGCSQTQAKAGAL